MSWKNDDTKTRVFTVTKVALATWIDEHSTYNAILTCSRSHAHSFKLQVALKSTSLSPIFPMFFFKSDVDSQLWEQCVIYKQYSHSMQLCSNSKRAFSWWCTKCINMSFMIGSDLLPSQFYTAGFAVIRIHLIIGRLLITMKAQSVKLTFL